MTEDESFRRTLRLFVPYVLFFDLARAVLMLRAPDTYWRHRHGVTFLVRLVRALQFHQLASYYQYDAPAATIKAAVTGDRGWAAAFAVLRAASINNSSFFFFSQSFMFPLALPWQLLTSVLSGSVIVRMSVLTAQGAAAEPSVRSLMCWAEKQMLRWSVLWLAAAPQSVDSYDSCMASAPYVLLLTLGLYIGVVVPTSLLYSVEAGRRSSYLRWLQQQQQQQPAVSPPDGRQLNGRRYDEELRQLSVSWPATAVLLAVMLASTGQVVIMASELWYLMQPRLLAAAAASWR